MKFRAIILLVLFLKSSLSMAYCCSTDFIVLDHNKEVTVCMAEKTSCCSQDKSTQQDHSDDHQSSSNHDNCKCLHLSVMDQIDYPIFQTKEFTAFHEVTPQYQVVYAHLYFANIFQPPKTV